MRKLFRLLALTLAALVALTALAFAEIEACPPVENGIREIQKYGNIVLDINGDDLLALGYEYGDIITVTIGGKALDMPICTDYNDVDTGALVMRVESSRTSKNGESRVTLSINGSDLATWLGIAEKTVIEEAPGYTWHLTEAWRDGVAATLSLKEKGGYLEQLKRHQYNLSIKREDYPDLTDEQYANFRPVSTTGMGANALYRSSSPVNPKYKRNREADAAVNAAGIRTVMNMADSEVVMKGYEDYAYSYYSKLDVIPLDMVVDFEKADFQGKLAEGYRFLASHETPFLIHCTVGKDRAGFAVAVLECLMGATADEVVADYMVSYYNYYGIAPGTAAYDGVIRNSISKFLPKAFGIESLEDADLAACAEAYLLKIGMTAEEIDALKTRLGTDIK